MNKIKNILRIIKFYITHSPIELRYAKLSFSQFGEDIILNSFLHKKNGFYVDIGAYHPFSYSNTYLFYKRGWEGINLEPNPHGFKLLDRYRKRDINLQLGVSTKESTLRFLPDSTFSRLIDPDLDNENIKNTLEVSVKPLAAILEEHLPPDKQIDFISIDCEGHDLKVLQSNNWEKYRPQYVVVEDDEDVTSSEIIPYMQSLGYSHFLTLELSRFFSDLRKQDTH